MNVAEVVSAIRDQELVGVVRRATGEPEARLASVATQRLTVINGFGAHRGLFRFRGEAEVAAGRRPWSAILKVVRRPSRASDEPGDVRYWRREADAYDSKLLAGIKGLRPARCLGVTTRDAETFTLWLEDLRDEYDGRWPLERYSLAAEHLGEMGAAHTLQAGAPRPPWLFRRHLGGRAPSRAMESFVLGAATWRHPDVRRLLPRSMADAVREQWQLREALQAALAEVPETLCHNDAHAQNLFSGCRDDGTAETVALDWELIGPGPLTADIGYLVIASMRRFMVDASHADALADAVLEGYVTGLVRGGWSGDPDTVRAAFTFCLALRVGLVAQILGILTDPALRAREERVWGRPADALVACWSEVVGFVLDRAQQAQKLLGPR